MSVVASTKDNFVALARTDLLGIWSNGCKPTHWDVKPIPLLNNDWHAYRWIIHFLSRGRVIRQSSLLADCSTSVIVTIALPCALYLCPISVIIFAFVVTLVILWSYICNVATSGTPWTLYFACTLHRRFQTFRSCNQSRCFLNHLGCTLILELIFSQRDWHVFI